MRDNRLLRYYLPLQFCKRSKAAYKTGYFLNSCCIKAHSSSLSVISGAIFKIFNNIMAQALVLVQSPAMSGLFPLFAELWESPRVQGEGLCLEGDC